MDGITGDGGATMQDIVGKGFTGSLDAGTPVVYDLANPHCYAGIWGPNTFDGEIVLCDRGGPTPIARVASSQNVAAAGGAGFALMNAQHQADTMHADEFVIPGVHISYSDGEALKAFLADNDEVTAGVAGYEFNLDNGLAIVGSPETVIRKLEEGKRRIGYDIFCTNHEIGHMPRQLVRNSIELFGKEVIPAFR
jgi:hypothetical protein